MYSCIHTYIVEVWTPVSTDVLLSKTSSFYAVGLYICTGHIQYRS